MKSKAQSRKLLFCRIPGVNGAFSRGNEVRIDTDSGLERTGFPASDAALPMPRRNFVARNDSAGRESHPWTCSNR